MEVEIAKAVTEKGDHETNEGESSDDVPNNSSVKRGRGRPVGSKKMKVFVSDISLSELASADPDVAPSPRGRGRPKLSSTELTEKDGLVEGQNGDSVPKPRGRGRPKGSKKQDSDKSITDHSPRKRGRPRKSPSQCTGETPLDLPNGGTERRKRGRPKGSVKRKLDSSASGEESANSPATPRKRGRPKGSLNKKLELSEDSAEADEVVDSPRPGRGQRPRPVTLQDSTNGISTMPRRGRGRPRKEPTSQPPDGSQPIKRGRGRPKGSPNKKPSVYKTHGKVGRPRKVTLLPARGKKRGRPRLNPLPAKRGRPRKYPLPSPEELKKPKVWKPLGRPRKYPRVDPPEGAPTAPRRSRGRPRKSESKKGAHLRKNVPTTQKPDNGPPRKRGRPKKIDDGTPQKKRGRPKGSVNKAKSVPQLDGALPNHSGGGADSLGSGAEGVRKADITETAPTEHRANTAETVIDQDAGGNDVGGRA